MNFLKKLSNENNFEREFAEDILNDKPYEHKKSGTPYVSPTVSDAATIEVQSKKEIDGFLQLASEFIKADAAATRQKRLTITINYLETYNLNQIRDNK